MVHIDIDDTWLQQTRRPDQSLPPQTRATDRPLPAKPTAPDDERFAFAVSPPPAPFPRIFPGL